MNECSVGFKPKKKLGKKKHVHCPKQKKTKTKKKKKQKGRGKEKEKHMARPGRAGQRWAALGRAGPGRKRLREQGVKSEVTG